MKRTLTLKSEHLIELAPAQLESVVGAQYGPTQQCTGNYDSLGHICDYIVIQSLGC